MEPGCLQQGTRSKRNWTNAQLILCNNLACQCLKPLETNKCKSKLCICLTTQERLLTDGRFPTNICQKLYFLALCLTFTFNMSQSFSCPRMTTDCLDERLDGKVPKGDLTDLFKWMVRREELKGVKRRFQRKILSSGELKAIAKGISKGNQSPYAPTDTHCYH